jgi:hypothetical protein
MLKSDKHRGGFSRQEAWVILYASRRFIAMGILILAVFGLAACGAPEIQPLLLGDAPWQSGETSTYRITDIDGNFAGRQQFVISAAETRLDESGWSFVRTTEAQGDQEEATVSLTNAGFVTRASTLERVTANGTERVNTTYENGQIDMELTTVEDVTTYQRVRIPSDARDRRVVNMLLRSLPLEADYAARLNRYLPVADLLDRVTLVVEEREEVTVPAGTFDSWRISLESTSSEEEVWIGVEPPYPLLKYTDGLNGGLFELEAFEP